MDVPSLEYSFKPGARPISIFCLKADFSDSSGTHNTGAVRIVNDVWKRCGWLTPPQAAYKGEYDVRIGVDGFPMDLFYDNDGTGANTYLGNTISIMRSRKVRSFTVLKELKDSTTKRP